jgi:tripartite-type tricarboxylate transporter receptor subunit TctC
VKSGKLRALGITTLTRSPLMPEVPSLGFEDVTWNGIVAPAGTPREALARLHAEIAKATSQPEFRKRYLERGIELQASDSPEAFSAYIRSEADAFAKLVQDAHIKVE